jgi:glutathione synthase/RimK-type ligase-like ATP-grasp enzyme
MTSDGFVLIVSTIVDAATDEVVRQLTALSVPHHRLNTENFPFSQSIALSYGTPGRAELVIDASALPNPTAIWYRRLRSPGKPQGMEEGIYDFCLRENRATMLGGLLGLSGRWMSPPAAVWQAENKPYQLAVAQALGLRIPRTVITNDAATVREAAAYFGRMIVKPARTGHVVYGGGDRAIFTSELLPEHMDDLSGVELSPAIYQELVPKRHDIRVTIVGRQVFAAAIDSQSDPAATIDWRHTDNPNLPHRRITLPEALRRQLLQLVDHLHLTFAAIDLVETPEGDFVFLEINPNGQWLWLDDMLDMRISSAVATWLAGDERQ